MDADLRTLEALRREIDAIDDRIHDAIVRRIELVEEIRRAKQGGPSIRPGREAAILRRLLARHAGSLPTSVIARIWREIIAAVCRLQSPFEIVVHATERSASYWDLARSHYGSLAPITLRRNVMTVIGAARDDAATLGILPLPTDGERTPWWPLVAGGGEDRPRIFARLPFCLRPEAPWEPVEAYVIGRIPPEPSGEDRSLLVVRLQGEMSRARFNETLAAVDLAGGTVAAYRESEGAAGEDRLIEVDGFVTDDDPRLARLREAAQGAVDRVVVLGAYAVPMQDLSRLP